LISHLQLPPNHLIHTSEPMNSANELPDTELHMGTNPHSSELITDHWIILAMNKSEKTYLLDSVSAMRHKRLITTGEVYIYKSRLNAHGWKQVHGIHHWDTYAPVVTWFVIWPMLTFVLLYSWREL